MNREPALRDPLVRPSKWPRQQRVVERAAAVSTTSDHAEWDGVP
jgi:hypothetical protein